LENSAELTLSKGRLESFSDGVFAIAITLLILEVHLPAMRLPASTQEQVRGLTVIWPQYLVYFVTFATIGIMWLNHHALLKNVRRVSHGIVLANLLLLSLISFLPFPTEVLARYGLTNVAVAYYGLTMTVISISYNILLQQAVAAHPGALNRVTLWTIAGLTFYPLATLIGWFAPVWGLAVMGLLALFYMQQRNVSNVVLRVPADPQR